jgi:general stress protein CsbA
MNIESILGVFISILSLCIIFVGFTNQIYKNWQEKKSGISMSIIGFGFVLLSIRIIYTYIRSDYFIMIPDIISLIIHVILIYQFFIYKKHE